MYEVSFFKLLRTIDDVEDMTFNVYALPCFGLVLFVMAFESFFACDLDLETLFFWLVREQCNVLPFIENLLKLVTVSLSKIFSDSSIVLEYRCLVAQYAVVTYSKYIAFNSQLYSAHWSSYKWVWYLHHQPAVSFPDLAAVILHYESVPNAFCVTKSSINMLYPFQFNLLRLALVAFIPSSYVFDDVFFSIGLLYHYPGVGVVYL
ncbi:hypothetical protein Tco_0493844 [Tanacetum coccineum]